MEAQHLIPGMATGELLFSNTGLSFWGGVSPVTGEILDRHHPLSGQRLKGKILAIPAGRGSCSGSGVLLELMLNGNGPAGIVFQEIEAILTLGVLVAREAFDVSIPIVVLSPENFRSLRSEVYVWLDGEKVSCSRDSAASTYQQPLQQSTPSNVRLEQSDHDALAGLRGPAVQTAMKILLHVTTLQNAEELIDVKQAHIDACVYTGEGGLRFATKLAHMGAKFAVPTTLNAISVDRRRWRELGVPETMGDPASQLADAYLSMGAQATFTCAPYLLESAPKADDNIGWAESNAVVFANSILGARTQKYPDFLDVCIALTGRAPLSGCHLDAGRLPKVLIKAPDFTNSDDSIWPLLGYCIGEKAGSNIPLVCGLEQMRPTTSDLRAFGAAFATTSSAPMFHIRGITPEAAAIPSSSLTELRQLHVTSSDLRICFQSLNTAQDPSLGLISLGNPHFSIEECQKLSQLCASVQRHPNVKAIITTSRHVYSQAAKAGYVESLDRFGFDFVTDTCWCMIEEPIIPLNTKNLMTNSAKYAHYAPGMVERGVHFGSLVDCVEAARQGEVRRSELEWLK